MKSEWIYSCFQLFLYKLSRVDKPGGLQILTRANGALHCPVVVVSSLLLWALAGLPPPAEL